MSVLVLDDTQPPGDLGRVVPGDLLVIDQTTEPYLMETADFSVLVFDDADPEVLENDLGPDFILLDDAQPPVLVQQPSGQEVLVITTGGPAGPKGDQGAPGSSFSYRQDTPAATWTVQHNLGRKPAVVLFLDEDPNTPVYTDITYPDLNTVVVEWPSPETGWAEI